VLGVLSAQGVDLMQHFDLDGFFVTGGMGSDQGNCPDHYHPFYVQCSPREFPQLWRVVENVMLTLNSLCTSWQFGPGQGWSRGLLYNPIQLAISMVLGPHHLEPIIGTSCLQALWEPIRPLIHLKNALQLPINATEFFTAVPGSKVRLPIHAYFLSGWYCPGLEPG